LKFANMPNTLKATKIRGKGIRRKKNNVLRKILGASKICSSSTGYAVLSVTAVAVKGIHKNRH